MNDSLDLKCLIINNINFLSIDLISYFITPLLLLFAVLIFW
ncbi:MAG: hypothetical protein KatS3mg028_0959 [Bacteroidia bacterium]|nr:MAG: hypothetical protein KatS3mg028_0959 [Bacteroidia bacterium]